MYWSARLDELNRAILANSEHAAPTVFNARIDEAEIEKVRYQRLVDATTEGLAGQRTWFGYPGASEQEISLRESQLGVKFTDDYRNFLKASNGFLIPGSSNGPLLPVAEVERFGDTNPAICDLWLRVSSAPDYAAEKRLKSLLRVSSSGKWRNDYVLVEPMPPPSEWPFTAYSYVREGPEPHASFEEIIDYEIHWQKRDFAKSQGTYASPASPS